MPNEAARTPDAGYTGRHPLELQVTNRSMTIRPPSGGHGWVWKYCQGHDACSYSV